MSTIVLIVLIVLLVGAVPGWPHSTTWGYTPSGIVTVVLVVWAALMIFDKVPF